MNLPFSSLRTGFEPTREAARVDLKSDALTNRASQLEAKLQSSGGSFSGPSGEGVDEVSFFR